MNELPPKWSEARLGDLLLALLDFRGRTPKKLGMEWGGTIPALSAVNVRQGNIDLSRTPHFGSDELYDRWMTTGDPAEGDIVLTMEAPLGNVARIPDNKRYILSQRVVLLKTRDGIDSGFLSHQMRSPDFRRRLLASATGTTATGISQARLVELSILVAPLAEQKRIADKLDALLTRVDACREHLNRVPGILKRFRQSVLAAATSGELTRQWREERGLGQAWDQFLLEEIIEGKPRNGYSPKAVEYATPVKSLTLTATTTGRFLGEHFKYIDEQIPADSHLWLRPGDVLIQRANTLEYVGVSAIFDGPENTFIYPDLMMKCRANKRVLPAFLHLVLSSHPVRKHFRENATGTAGNMPKINQQTVLSAPAVVPLIEEQAQIVARTKELLEMADALERAHTAALAKVTKLTPSALTKAFRGELVAQDPNDQPTSALLAKLKAEQANAPAEPSRLRSKTPRKRPKMSNADKDSIKAEILRMKTDRFSFDELRAHVSGDYESLRAALFELLEEPSPVLRQVFDKKAKAMQLVRVKT